MLGISEGVVPRPQASKQFDGSRITPPVPRLLPNYFKLSPVSNSGSSNRMTCFYLEDEEEGSKMERTMLSRKRKEKTEKRREGGNSLCLVEPHGVLLLVVPEIDSKTFRAHNL